MEIKKTIESALALGTDLEWTIKSPGVGLYKAYCGPYVVTVESRNPKEDHTWTLMLEDQDTGDEHLIGAIETDSVGSELKALVEEHI